LDRCTAPSAIRRETTVGGLDTEALAGATASERTYDNQHVASRGSALAMFGFRLGTAPRSPAALGRLGDLDTDRKGAVMFARISQCRAWAVLVAALLVPAFASAAKPEIDPSYAEGNTYYMIGPKVIFGAAQSMPNAYAHAEELYLVGYPQEVLSQPGGLPSGYVPQCNPCFHAPPPFIFHDHVLTGAPGLGKNGTAGAYKAPWKIILVMYTVAAVSDPNFVPVKSVEELDQGEADGKFQILDKNATNPYEIDTGNLLICPFVAPEA
jgi:hypothetical protein